ncbi:MAG: hypothetical protein ABJO57_05005 [Lentilitoribacter sp.]
MKQIAPDMDRSVQMTDIIKSKSIQPHDVFELRNTIYKDGITTQKQAATLVALEKVCTDKCADWTNYYVTSLADYILCHCEPHGGISDSNSDWLRRVITQNGLVRTQNEFQLLKSLLERAVPAAPSFCALVLDQLHQAMLGFPTGKLDKPLSQQDASFLPTTSSMDVLDELSRTVPFN